MEGEMAQNLKRPKLVWNLPPLPLPHIRQARGLPTTRASPLSVSETKDICHAPDRMVLAQIFTATVTEIFPFHSHLKSGCMGPKNGASDHESMHLGYRVNFGHWSMINYSQWYGSSI